MTDELTVREMREAISMMTAIMENSLSLTLHMLEENCVDGHDHTNMDYEDFPEFDDFDVKVFLLFEEQTNAIFKMMRRGLIEKGYAELSEEVTT